MEEQLYAQVDYWQSIVHVQHSWYFDVRLYAVVVEIELEQLVIEQPVVPPVMPVVVIQLVVVVVETLSILRIVDIPHSLVA